MKNDDVMDLGKFSDDPPPEEKESYLSTLKIVLTLGFLIFAAEAAVMIIISHLPPFPTAWSEALFDSALLMVFVSPTLYYFVFRPLFIDIQEQKKLQREMREVVKVKTYFTSMVSHELRTPLAAIKESIALVTDGIVGPVTEAQRDCLKISQRNVERLTRLISDILDFQKIESGRVLFDFQEYDLNELIREVHKTMLPLAEKNSVAFRLNLDEAHASAVFDRDKIIQTLTNLIGNALKFTSRGNVTVATRHTGGVILVAVQDTGCGIKTEDLPKLFQKFTQLGSGRANQEGGTGLGLVICKEIIDKHHGKIWVESVFGEGSTFYFTLPVKQTSQASVDASL